MSEAFLCLFSKSKGKNKKWTDGIVRVRQGANSKKKQLQLFKRSGQSERTAGAMLDSVFVDAAEWDANDDMEFEGGILVSDFEPLHGPTHVPPPLPPQSQPQRPQLPQRQQPQPQPPHLSHQRQQQQNQHQQQRQRQLQQDDLRGCSQPQHAVVPPAPSLPPHEPTLRAAGAPAPQPPHSSPSAPPQHPKRHLYDASHGRPEPKRPNCVADEGRVVPSPRGLTCGSRRPQPAVQPAAFAWVASEVHGTAVRSTTGGAFWQ